VRTHRLAKAKLAATSPASRKCATPWQASLALRAKPGGADRDRTDDLKLAKLALSQLSYGPNAKLFVTSPASLLCSFAVTGFALQMACQGVAHGVGEAWWARDELNVRPHAYQACALTT
jgi:hypothetical protein